MDRLTEKLIFATILAAPLYLLKFSVFGIPTNVLEILIILSFISSIPKINFFHIRLYGRKETKIYFFGICLILTGLIISTIINKNYFQGFGIIKSWFVLPILFGFVIYNFTKEKKNIIKILKLIYFESFVVAAISLIYFLNGNLTYDFRLKAFYLSPNYLAMFLAPSIFIGFYLIKNDLKRLHKTKNYISFFSKIISLIIILFIIYQTYSYTTWLSIIIASAISFLFLTNAIQKIKILFVSFFIIVFLFAFQIGNSKFTSFIKNNPRSSTASRIMIYKSSFKMLKDNLIFGIGPGNFQNRYLEYQKYFPPYLEWAVPQPHNLYLAFWLQSGIFGLVGFILLISAWLKKIIQYIKQKNSFLAAIILGIIISVLIQGLFDTPYWKNDLAFFFWLIFSLPFKTH